MIAAIAFSVGFIVGAGLAVVVAYWLARKAEHAAFRSFWGAP